jgi:hypothetical protein
MIWVVLIVAAFVIAVGGIVSFVTARRERSRAEQLAEFAATCGMHFSDALPPMAMDERYMFPLFDRGRDGNAKNYLDATADGASICLFDYFYTTGSGKHRQTHAQSVCWCASPRLRLPSFTLCPRNFWHRVGGYLGYRRIEIDQYPEFGEAYTLRGEQEEAIRELFDRDLIQTLMAIPAEYTIEAQHRQFIQYKPGRRAKTHELSECLNHVYQVFRALEGPGAVEGAVPYSPGERNRPSRSGL